MGILSENKYLQVFWAWLLAADIYIEYYIIISIRISDGGTESRTATQNVIGKRSLDKRKR